MPRKGPPLNISLYYDYGDSRSINDLAVRLASILCKIKSSSLQKADFLKITGLYKIASPSHAYDS